MHFAAATEANQKRAVTACNYLRQRQRAFIRPNSYTKYWLIRQDPAVGSPELPYSYGWPHCNAAATTLQTVINDVCNVQ